MTETAQAIVEMPKTEPPVVQTVVPMTLVQRAFEQGNLELVERAMALQERWEANQAKKAFEAALAAARGKLPVVIKNRKVDFTSPKGRTNYAYEDLAGIAAAIDTVLADEGLSYRFRPEVNAQVLKVTCIISHRDGHTEESSLSAAHDHSGNKNDIQAVGSTQTYLQRYCLKAALGLSAGADDDGRSRGNGNGNGNGAASQQQTEQPTSITPEQVEMLRQAMTMREMPEERLIKWASKAWKGGGQIADITDIPASAFQICLDKIRSSGEPK